MTGTAPQPRVDAEHPWPALLSFREDDQRYFGGREEEVEALYRRIGASRLTLLFGLSGLGKSSLLRAGLFPRLRREHYFPVYIRLRYGRDMPPPVEQVQSEIVMQARASRIEAPEPRPGETVWQYFHRADADFWDDRNYPCTPVLVFDQFEELFTKGREVPEHANAVIEEIADLAEGASPALMREAAERDPSLLRQVFDDRYRLLIGIRSDYLAQLQGISDRVRAVFANRYELRRMSGTAALKSTLIAGGHLMEEEVARRVVRFVAGAKESDASVSVDGLEVEPALLSLVCSELNATRIANGEPKITATMLSGTKDEILSRFYESSFADVAPELRVLVEDKLVTRDGKGRNFISEQTARETAGVTDEDLGKLVHRRLLRLEESGSSRRMELTHDLLTTVAAASRATREHRLQIEEAQRAQAEAERREASARRALRRSRAAMLVFFVLLAAAVAGPFIAARWTASGARRVETDFWLGRALQQLPSEQPAEGLAYLARVVRLDRGNAAARTLLYEQLVTRAWPVPVRAFGPQAASDETAFSADGARVAFRKDRILEMWDVATGRRIGQPLQTSVAPDRIVFASDDRSLLLDPAFGSDKNERVVIWDPAVGPPLTFRDLRALPGLAGCSYLQLFDVSGTGKELAAGCDERLAIVPFRGQPGETFPPLPATDGVKSARFAPDPRFIVVEAFFTSTLLDRRRPEGGPFAGAYPLVFSGDGRRVAISKAENKTVEVRDLETWALAGTIGDPARTSLDRTGSAAMTITDDVLRLWRVGRGEPSFERRVQSRPVAAGFSPDGARIFVASKGLTHWWGTGDGASFGEPIVQPDTKAARVDRRGNIVLVSTAAQVWQLASAVLPPALAESVKPRDDRSFHFSAERKSAVFAGEDGKITGFNVASGRREWTSPVVADLVAIDPSGSRAVVVDDGAASLVDTRTWKSLLALSKQDEELDEAIFSGDGKVLVLVFDGEPSIRVLDAATGKALAPPFAAPKQTFLAMSHDGTVFATGRTNEVVVWKVTGHRAVLRIPVKKDVESGALSFSPDGRSLALLTGDGRLRVWDLTSGSVRAAKPEVEKTPTGVAFSPDGRLLAVTSRNGVALCDPETLDCTGKDVLVHPDVVGVEFSLNGKRVLTADRNEVRVWDVATQQPVTLPLPWDLLFAGLSPDGTSLYAMRDRELYRLPLPSIDDADAALLADLGEALAGLRVERLGVTEPVDGAAALTRLGQRCQGTRGLACDLARWIVAAPEKRTISPVSNLSAADYVKRRRSMDPGNGEWWRLKALFPNEPSLGPAP